MRTPSSVIVLAGLLSVAAAPLAAQQHAAAPAPAGSHRMRWGPQITYDFNGDNLGGGARLEYSLAGLLGSPRIDGIAELQWFPGSVDVFELAYNVVYRFNTPSVQPYAGGGLSFAIASGNGNTSTDLHLNAVGGLKFKPMGKVTPVVQMRYVFVQGDALLLTAGILF